MKRKMTGSANEAKTLRMVSTPNTTHNERPVRAVIGMGIGSVIHQMITNVRIEAKICADAVMPGIGMKNTIMAEAGPRKIPILARMTSNFSSET